jgi:methylglutaconyl-CoA hydratase
VVLDGAGETFCSGADLEWMREAADYPTEANIADALRLGELLAEVRDGPRPVVVRVHGAAMGGGAGLVAAADVAVSAQNARFAFSEVRLGLVPAVISPFVVPRIGLAAARELFLTGETFAADHALRIGLVRHVVPESELDATVAARVDALLAGGPEAQAVVKGLLRRVVPVPEGLARYTAATIAQRRSSLEGREGMAAFLERRPPSWKLPDGPA